MKRPRKQTSDASIEIGERLDAERESTDETPDSQVTQAGAAVPPAGVEVPPEADTSDALQARVDSLENSLLRAKADYQNLQRRTAMERADAVWFANSEIMRSLVGVLDDLERSLAAARGLEGRDAVIDGVRLVHTNLMQALRMHGLEPIDALHEPFDPQIHEAMLQQPSAEHRPGTVIEEIARGYRLRGRVVRPSKVIVSKAAEPPADGDGSGRADAPDRGTEPIDRGLDTEA